MALTRVKTMRVRVIKEIPGAYWQPGQAVEVPISLGNDWIRRGWAMEDKSSQPREVKV